jgi:hypothetical protein
MGTIKNNGTIQQYLTKMVIGFSVKLNTLLHKAEFVQSFQHKVSGKHPKVQSPIADLTTFQEWFG